MIILNANLELKLTFEKLIQMMKEPVEWNGQFVVVGDYLILPGRVRSLFFNFESQKVLTNIIEIPEQKDGIIEIGDKTKLQNVFNMVLYAFGKWEKIQGLKVEQDYAKLNELFYGILREISVEPSFNNKNFRFYKEGIRLNYEDVIQCAIDIEEERAEEEEKREENPAEAGGLWHKLIWKKQMHSFLKTDTTFEERQKNRLGNNFYMVGYQCPKCKQHLHMVVYPEGKEFRIETTEGAVIIARAYTCNNCTCFYTARPQKLLAEGDVYVMDFMTDTHAYDDYLELLGADGDRVSNYRLNEFEAVLERKAHMQIEEKQEPLEELCEQIQNLSDLDLQKIEAKMEEGFYSPKSVEQFEGKIRKEVRIRRIKAKEESRKAKTVPETPMHTQRKEDGVNLKKVKPIKTTQETKEPAGIEKSQSNASFVTPLRKQPVLNQKTIAAEEPSLEEMGTNLPIQEIPKARREAAKKRYEAKLKVLDRLSETQLNALKKELLQENNLYQEEKQPFLDALKERAEREKREHIQRLSTESDRQSYAKIQRIIEEIESIDVPQKEKEAVLEKLYSERKRQGEAETASLMQKMPVNLDLKQYHNYMERLKGYPDVDLSQYEAVLYEKKRAAEENEISNMIRHAKTTDREGLTNLMQRLRQREFEEKLLLPYMKKLEDKLRTIDENTISRICANPMQMTMDEAMEAYRRIEEGIFLPELKTNALEMLKKRLIKLKTDECELLVHKLKESIKGKIKENDNYHFYPARKVMMKNAEPEEIEVINYALETYGTKRGMFEYPILVIDTSRNHSGKEGMILTPEHLFYRTLLNAYVVPIEQIRDVETKTGLLNAGISLILEDGMQIKIPYAVDRKELHTWGRCFNEFIRYLKDKPDSRKVAYLVKEEHETICCFRCGYTYQGGNVCPKCGYKKNR